MPLKLNSEIMGIMILATILIWLLRETHRTNPGYILINQSGYFSMKVANRAILHAKY